MRIFRRTLVVLALLFWQGGFTFYGVVVIPIGAATLGGHSVQSEVTRKVTPVLHGAGAVALGLLLVDAFAGTRRGRLRVGLILAMLAALVAQVAITARMEALADQLPDARAVFYQWHRAYLLVSTVQWLVFVATVPVVLLAWRDEDRAAV
jgi:hypothetical protein